MRLNNKEISNKDYDSIVSEIETALITKTEYNKNGIAIGNDFISDCHERVFGENGETAKEVSEKIISRKIQFKHNTYESMTLGCLE